MVKVNEIFKSIQGESSFSGMPCTFVRLSGCNLRCRYCDTEYAYYNFKEMTLRQILSSVKREKIPLVEITGGEPLLQSETPGLIRVLLDSGHTVLLETNGTLPLDSLEKELASASLHIIMDVKTPGSGAQENLVQGNLAVLRPWDEIKLVIQDRSDYLWARKFILHQNLPGKVVLNFSPVFGRLHPSDLSAWIIKDGLNVRLNLQIHKIIWGEFQQGV